MRKEGEVEVRCPCVVALGNLPTEGRGHQLGESTSATPLVHVSFKYET